MVQTRPYTIPRSVLSRLTALYYLRTFWPILILPFLFGVAVFIFGPNKEFRVFGLVLMIWPFTAFIRGLLLTGKAAKAWSQPTVMSFDDEAFYFQSPLSALSLKRSVVRRLVRLFGFYLLQFRRFEFVPIPEGVFASDEDRERFEASFT